jgi:NAD(P)-dependent dehydrogenase (short-subunit alcohol dehydrogenase family)
MPNIVMTGATTGIGRVAAETLLAQPGTRLTVGVRTPGTALAGARELTLDLASLASVRAFADALGPQPIDILLLNAGGQRPDVAARSADGHELTFATNHLAHFLLLRLLEPRLAPEARVVLTSSGTHDPAERTGVPPPRHANANRLAYPETDPQLDASPLTAGMRAYSSSKLANLMTARAFARRRPDLVVTSYDPGLTPGTSLVRNQHWAVRILVWPLLPLIMPFRSGMNSLTDAGRALAALAASETPPPGRIYASLRKACLTWPDPSTLVRDETAIEQLWADSEALVGLDQPSATGSNLPSGSATIRNPTP